MGTKNLYNSLGVINTLNSEVTLSEMLKHAPADALEADDLMGVIIGLLIRSQAFKPADDRFATVTPEEWANVVRKQAFRLCAGLEDTMFEFVHACESYLDEKNGVENK